MSIIQLITDALETLKEKKGEAWYQFEQCFWPKVEPKLTVKLLSGARQTLSMLNYEFERKLLKMCKHEDSSVYETLHVCYTCEAKRTRERDDDSMWGNSNPWSDWHWR